MTTDSIPKLFSQLSDVLPQLEFRSYFELGPNVKDLLSNFWDSDQQLSGIKAWSFVLHPQLIWGLVNGRGNLRRHTVIKSIHSTIRDSLIRKALLHNAISFEDWAAVRCPIRSWQKCESS